MKKHLFFLFMLFVPLVVSAQNDRTIVPGNGKIDLEKFGTFVNTDIDISKLSLAELRILKWAPGARQGELIKDADIRDMYQRTSWYSDRMYKRYEAENYPQDFITVEPIKLSEAEKAFIKKIEAREAELKRNNFKIEGGIVNTANAVNYFQLPEYNGALDNMLKRNGFAIVEDHYDQLFQVYDINEYQEIPNFVTTDLYLQAFHIYFDALLRNVEEKVLMKRVGDFCKSMQALMVKAQNTSKKEIKELAQWNEAYFAVAISLLNNVPFSVTQGNAFKDMAEIEIQKVKDADPDNSEFLEYLDPNIPFTYNLFLPRGHYTRSENLKRYFMAMMWLQSVPFATDKENQLKRAAMLAQTLNDNPDMNKKLHEIVDPMTFIMGEPDNVGIIQMQDIMKKNNLTLDLIVSKKSNFKRLMEKTEELAAKMTRILPKFVLTSKYKVNLMPQRYMPDAEVLQEMVDAENTVTKRGESKGLDYFAAMGCTPAERILIEELQEAQKWDKYQQNLDRMKARMKQIDWKSTVTNSWVDNLNELWKTDDAFPYFMKTPQWQKKNLNTALASWAEMKHDAILYAKQPMLAEAGDGEDVEPPIYRGYVEPNVKFWTKALEIIKMTKKAFDEFGLDEEKIEIATEGMENVAENLLEISKMELKGEKIDREKYEYIRNVGGIIEYLTLSIISDDEYIQSWSYVKGADKRVALVADVLTANGTNNLNKTVLYEAVGPAYEIYVLVEIEGYLYLTRGAVFSYREFSKDVFEDRLTDEEWQAMIKEQPALGTPQWMKEIILTREQMPKDEDEYRYYYFMDDDYDDGLEEMPAE